MLRACCVAVKAGQAQPQANAKMYRRREGVASEEVADAEVEMAAGESVAPLPRFRPARRLWRNRLLPPLFQAVRVAQAVCAAVQRCRDCPSSNRLMTALRHMT